MPDNLVLELSDGLMMAMQALIKCSRENEALKPDQLEAVLRETLDKAGNDKNEPRYVVLQELLKLL